MWHTRSNYNSSYDNDELRLEPPASSSEAELVAHDLTVARVLVAPELQLTSIIEDAHKNA